VAVDPGLFVSRGGVTRLTRVDVGLTDCPYYTLGTRPKRGLREKTRVSSSKSSEFGRFRDRLGVESGPWLVNHIGVTTIHGLFRVKGFRTSADLGSLSSISTVGASSKAARPRLGIMREGTKI
ncbi:hypothetical protein CRG98_023932, partial [Punica granatum]